MSVHYSQVQGIIFPPDAPSTPEAEILEAVRWSAGATTVRVHIPFVPGYTKFWPEWSSTPDFSADLHRAAPIEPQGGFNALSDVYIRELVGFAPESTWYFRLGISDAGELPPYAAEQWLDP